MASHTELPLDIIQPPYFLSKGLLEGCCFCVELENLVLARLVAYRR